jgi:hypothetical protein
MSSHELSAQLYDAINEAEGKNYTEADTILTKSWVDSARRAWFSSITPREQVPALSNAARRCGSGAAPSPSRILAMSVFLACLISDILPSL